MFDVIDVSLSTPYSHARLDFKTELNKDIKENNINPSSIKFITFPKSTLFHIVYIKAWEE